MNQSILSFDEIDHYEQPDFNPYEDVEVNIEYISPAHAALLKSRNYEYNRALIRNNVIDLTKMMTDDTFVLSPDCVVVDGDGILKNAQHRMQAIIESGKGQWFVVMRNVTHDIGSITDTGRSRKMFDRITFSGTRINSKQCSIVRHAMCDISGKVTGTMQYSKPYQDKIVKDTFKRFRDYFDFLNSNRYMSSSYNALMLGAGLKIWAHMKANLGDYLHKMTAEQRVSHWIEIVAMGSPESTPYYDLTVDGAAAKVHNAIKDNKIEGGQHWNDAPALRKTVHAAYKFMNGETFNRNLTAISNDPFEFLREMPPTNPAYVVPEGIVGKELRDFDTEAWLKQLESE